MTNLETAIWICRIIYSVTLFCTRWLKEMFTSIFLYWRIPMKIRFWMLTKAFAPTFDASVKIGSIAWENWVQWLRLDWCAPFLHLGLFYRLVSKSHNRIRTTGLWCQKLLLTKATDHILCSIIGRLWVYVCMKVTYVCMGACILCIGMCIWGVF